MFLEFLVRRVRLSVGTGFGGDVKIVSDNFSYTVGLVGTQIILSVTHTSF